LSHLPRDQRPPPGLDAPAFTTHAFEAEEGRFAIQETRGTGSLGDLRELPADKIVAVQRDCKLGCAGTIRVGLSVDGYFMPDAPTAIYATSLAS
jgi:hypothetical protein